MRMFHRSSMWRMRRAPRWPRWPGRQAWSTSWTTNRPRQLSGCRSTLRRSARPRRQPHLAGSHCARRVQRQGPPRTRLAATLSDLARGVREPRGVMAWQRGPGLQSGPGCGRVATKSTPQIVLLQRWRWYQAIPQPVRRSGLRSRGSAPSPGLKSGTSPPGSQGEQISSSRSSALTPSSAYTSS